MKWAKVGDQAKEDAKAAPIGYISFGIDQMKNSIGKLAIRLLSLGQKQKWIGQLSIKIVATDPKVVKTP